MQDDTSVIFPLDLYDFLRNLTAIQSYQIEQRFKFWFRIGFTATKTLALLQEAFGGKHSIENKNFRVVQDI